MSENYNQTLNLPHTDFSMRAGLPAKEPAMLSDWLADDLYEQIIRHNEGKPKYILHDGPPYANGNIHMGTAMNKILKDIVCRYANMAGYCSPYVPGYDTHGLPIELKAIADAGAKSDISQLELRRLCRDYALKFIDKMNDQFQRLGVVGDFKNPYLTLKPEFEAKQIEVFGEMARKGYIYKGLKSVYWCPVDRTALAEAEIEYSDDPCDSIYVRFRIEKDNGVLASAGIPLDRAWIVIWTTTTWTLPANVAIAAGPENEYVFVRVKDDYLLMAVNLVDTVMADCGITDYEITGQPVKGEKLAGIEAAHPFLDRVSPVILGDEDNLVVTLDSGSGFVHIAPGHGEEDFNLCHNRYPQLPVLVPVDDGGCLTAEAGPFAGLNVWKANPIIADALRKNGSLLGIKRIVHQYPHCWRCHSPIIFRATKQWFCSVEAFKEQTYKAIDEVKWVPAWGRERMTAMVRDRNDWCISRQRTWGVPIPAFYCKKCGRYHITPESIAAVSALFRREGSDGWYTHEASEILPAGTKCEFCGGTEFTKEKDIMDVWFDSGSSHLAVLDVRKDLEWPCDVYLEGSDQFRGWFQSSLLTSVAVRGTAPYRTVVSCGWVVDGQGRQMHKSLGNGIDPADIIKDYGADIIRLWVASSDYHSDVRISKEILKQLSEAYRKIRNTARFMLSNLYDFDPDRDQVSDADLTDLDRWALARMGRLISTCKTGYGEFDYHAVYSAAHTFCVIDMSNFYLDVIKDRLYINKADSLLRRAAQTAMFRILVALTKVMAPILAFTAQEIWQYVPAFSGKQKYVAMEEISDAGSCSLTDEEWKMWDRIVEIRDDVRKALEEARDAKLIGSSLEAMVTLGCSDELYAFAKPIEGRFADLFIVSKVSVVRSGDGRKGDVEGLAVAVGHAPGVKCARCWQYTEDVGKDPKHPDLCARCASILES